MPITHGLDENEEAGMGEVAGSFLPHPRAQQRPDHKLKVQLLGSCK